MKHQVRVLFHELVDLSPGERERVFGARQVAPEIRAEVESLLGFDSSDVHGLTNSVADAAEQMLRAADGGEVTYCGPYRLVRLLGRGGMGAVYLGERTDGEIQQRAAIKLMSAQGHRPAWRERFLRERQLLASLHHPSIVHVIDAGHTPDGRPYLVMEYVEGMPIDLYAATVALRDRLTLFLRVCDGVSHAHRHLIIHRDLKPSNILVDASGQPKLLDFGIARLLDDTGDMTQTVERLLTPNYASPEQLRGSAQTTATDVYSLGAVLYKLLTGRSPHESESYASQAMEVIAGRKEIPRASGLNPDLSSDVDYILRKALRPEPEERYASVEAFGNDIRGFLESRPVEARSGNTWYRTRKFMRRYRLPVAAAVLVVASLATGLYVANRERAIAQRRFVEVRQLANKLFDIDLEARRFAGSTKTRQLIVDTSLEYLRRLSAEVRGDSELSLEVGNAYMRVARVQGVPISANLGQMDQAEQNLGIAERFVQSVLASEPSNQTAFLRSAQIAHDRMLLARFNGRNDDALALAQKSAEWLQKFSVNTKDKDETDAVMATYMNVAQQQGIGQRFDDALRLARRGTDIARSIHSQPYLGMFLWVSAGVLVRQGDLENALNAIREAVSLLEPRPENIDQGRILNHALALILEGKILGEDQGLSLGRSEEAVVSLERAFEIADHSAHQDTKDQGSRGNLTESGLALADILRHSDPRRALDIYDHVLRHLAEIPNNRSFRRFEVNALARSTAALRALGRGAEVQRRLEAAFARLSELKLYPADKIPLNSETPDALRALANYEAEKGNASRAADIYNQLLHGIQGAHPNPETDLRDALRLSNLYEEAAAVHRRTGHSDVASGLEAQRLELWRGWDGKLPNNGFIRRQWEAVRLAARVP